MGGRGRDHKPHVIAVRFVIPASPAHPTPAFSRRASSTVMERGYRVLYCSLCSPLTTRLMPSFNRMTLKLISRPTGQLARRRYVVELHLVDRRQRLHGLQFYDHAAVDNHVRIVRSVDLDASIGQRNGMTQVDRVARGDELQAEARRIHRLEQARSQRLVDCDGAADDAPRDGVRSLWIGQHDRTGALADRVQSADLLIYSNKSRIAPKRTLNLR